MNETSHFSAPRHAAEVVHGSVNEAAADISELSERIGQSTADAGAAVRDATRVVGAAAAEAGHRVYEQGQRAGHGIANQVEKQPIISLLAAATAGLLAGLLLARR